jgi:hypothetical protein
VSLTRWLASLALLLGLSGCAYYSTSGGLIGGIRTVAVPLADNDTPEFGIAELMTERVERAYSADGRIRVVDEESADAVLYLTIRSLEDAPFTYTADEVTEQYRFSVRAVAELVRSADDDVLLELPRLEGWGTYDAGLADDEGRELAVAAALDMIVEELLDSVTSSW